MRAFTLLILSSLLCAAFSAQPVLRASAFQTPTGSYVALAWDASPTAGAAYNVYRTLAAGGACPAALAAYGAPLTSSVAALLYDDGAITAGAYCYVVTATENGAESLPSSAASVSVLPQPPSGLTAVYK